MPIYDLPWMVLVRQTHYHSKTINLVDQVPLHMMDDIGEGKLTTFYWSNCLKTIGLKG